MLAISGNVNYYRISPQFAITNVFCVQNDWPFDALLFSTEDDVINDLLSCESIHDNQWAELTYSTRSDSIDWG